MISWADVSYQLSLIPIAFNEIAKGISGTIRREHQWFLWPPHLVERIQNHTFPELSALLIPALGYFMILNVARFVLQYFIFRVSKPA